MCLATPGKIKEINEKTALVDFMGKEVWIKLELLTNPKKGEWVIAHKDLAIGKVPENDALEIINLIKESGHSH
jgi:hydrogenase assembly chaperone HypC/HupF